MPICIFNHMHWPHYSWCSNQLILSKIWEHITHKRCHLFWTNLITNMRVFTAWTLLTQSFLLHGSVSWFNYRSFRAIFNFQVGFLAASFTCDLVLSWCMLPFPICCLFWAPRNDLIPSKVHSCRRDKLEQGKTWVINCQYNPILQSIQQCPS